MRVSRQGLTKMLDAYLKEQRRAEGGDYAQPVGKDIDLLCSIVNSLIELKFEPDSDGDYPINFTIVNRTKYGPLHFVPVPYEHEAVTPQQKREVLRAIHVNYHIAHSAVDTYLKMRAFDLTAKEKS